MSERWRVKVTLTRAQRKMAGEKGCVFLSARQAARVRGKLTAAAGAGRPKGGHPMCGCGCGLTLERAIKRHPRRAEPLAVEPETLFALAGDEAA